LSFIFDRVQGKPKQDLSLSSGMIHVLVLHILVGMREHLAKRGAVGFFIAARAVGFI
jgi:hypothetical protein